MGSNSSIQLQKDDLDQLSHESGFTQNQIKRLYTRFTTLDKTNTGYLNREDLSFIPELNINPLGERIMQILIDDNGTNGQLNFKNFVKVLSTFRRGKNHDNKENKLKFLFKIYDRDNDGRINQKEMEDVLHMMVGDNIPNDQVQSIASRTISEISANGTITYDDFCTSLQKIDIDEKLSMKFLT